MDDNEAGKQIQQMVNFILHEAKDTAESITAKANEDFNIEKLKLVQQMKDKIRTDFSKKKKAEETKKAIDRSTAINRSRLRKIEARQQCIAKLQSEVGDALKVATKGDAKYKSILSELIVQGCLKLMEEEVTIRVRPSDINVAKSVLDTAALSFSKTVKAAVGANRTVKITVDSQNLPANSLGGCVVCCQGGLITVDNTLDTRLGLVMENDRPALRKMLFPAL
jgi:V-type H+-transporting ATPase subunit E